jgi:hypothetical protein
MHAINRTGGFCPFTNSKSLIGSDPEALRQPMFAALAQYLIDGWQGRKEGFVGRGSFGFILNKLRFVA